MQVIQSPVTGSYNTSLSEEFSTATIIQKYQDQGLDVNNYFKGLDKISLYTCNDTGYRFYYPFSIFGDDVFYEALQQNMATYYGENKWEHVEAKKMVGNGEKVLEIGAGSGFFLQQLQSLNCEITGLELNTKAIKTAQQKGISILNELIEDHVENNREKYDVVCSFQVLEHISDIKGFLNDSLSVLKKGGKLIIGVPHNNPYIYRHDKWHTLNLPPHHAGLWTRGSFEQLPAFFDIKLKSVSIEPIKEYKEWFLAQKKHYATHSPAKAALLGLIPRFVYKRFLKLIRNRINGRNILVMYEKM